MNTPKNPKKKPAMSPALRKYSVAYLKRRRSAAVVNVSLAVLELCSALNDEAVASGDHTMHRRLLEMCEVFLFNLGRMGGGR